MKDNNVTIFNNPKFGQVRTIMMDNGQIGFLGKDIATAIGYRNPSNAILTHVDQDDKTSYLFQVSGSNYKTKTIFINESGVYSLILSSKHPRAREFKHWITSEVLPSIRKNGAYMTNSTLQKALENPDFLIQLATQLREEKQKRIEAEQWNYELKADNEYKQSVIEGLVEEIPLADMRQRITQIMRNGGIHGIRDGYNLLYKEFDKKYHINTGTRIRHSGYRGTKMDYIEKELDMLPELYELACKLFESQYESLIESWGKAITRARGERRKKIIDTNI